jgi:hypothetical protein
MQNTPGGPIKKVKPPKLLKTNSIFMKYAYRMYYFIVNQTAAINQSKIFAGIMIITINIASKFVNFRLSKTTESYLKYTFSRDILIFAIMWMGTRDIIIAGMMTILFMVIMDFLLNENSVFCILPESFTHHHIEKMDENAVISQDEIRTIETILEKAKKINHVLNKGEFPKEVEDKILSIPNIKK